MLFCFAFGATDDLKRDGVRNVSDEERNGAGAARGKRPRGGVRAVAEFRGGVLDAFFCRFTDPAEALWSFGIGVCSLRRRCLP